MNKDASAFTVLAKFFVLILIAAIPSIANAQVFDNEADWESAICGEVISEELDFGQTEFIGTPLDPTLTTAWGLFDISETSTDVNNGLNLFEDRALLLDPDTPGTLIPDPALGFVDGFSLGYASTGGSFCVELEDGTIIEEIIPAITGDPAIREFIGWVNNTGMDVVEVIVKLDEIPSVDSPPGFILYGIDFSFKEPAVETCQSQLQDVIDALALKLDSDVSDQDRFFLENAIYELECAQNPYFWETEDRLSDLGGIFFRHNFYATYFLGCVSDQELVADCLIGIQDLLGCVVDAEIQFALENPDVNTNLLAYAQEFEDYADAFAEAEQYLSAVVLHFYGWLLANNA